MYTIKEASARSGVGAPLIRAWERRYGVVSPTRTASGYRLYDDRAIRVLSTMRSLVASGWTASEAARALRSGEVPVPEAPVPGQPAPGSTSAGPSAASPAETQRDRLVAAFIAAAEATSQAETEAILDEILASGSFEAVVDDLLLPATAALGDAWAAGRISVAAEHAASAAVGRRLAAAYQAAGVPARSSVVVGLPPGSLHELGALAFATALRRRGVGVLYLGPDVTVDGWADAARRTGARIAVLGVVTEADARSAGEVVAALARPDGPAIAVGGAAARAVRGDVVRLPDRVVDAASLVAGSLGRRRGSRPG